MNNHSVSATDILLFGGERYTEPIVAEGPFVLNSKLEIAEAYRDYFAGKYGEINLKTEIIKLHPKAGRIVPEFKTEY